MTEPTRAELLTEWLKFYQDAVRFGSADPAAIADILAFGKTPEEVLASRKTPAGEEK